VEQAVPQDLLQVALDGQARQPLPVEAERVDRGAVVDLLARAVLEHEDLGRGVLPVDQGHLDPVDAGKVGAEGVGVLAPVCLVFWLDCVCVLSGVFYLSS
jgi:hypothetical protein